MTPSLQIHPYYYYTKIVTFVQCTEIYCYNTEAGNHNGLLGVNSDVGLTGKGQGDNGKVVNKCRKSVGEWQSGNDSPACGGLRFGG